VAKNTTVLIVKVEQVHLAFPDKAVQRKRVQNVLVQTVRTKVHTRRNLATRKAQALETVKALHLAALDAANNE
jgi:hypothetical protein